VTFGGWNKNLPMWDFYVRDDLKNWHTSRISIKKGENKSSHQIASEFDDIAEDYFHWRDKTESGLPFVEDGEVYLAYFDFKSARDKEEFDRRYQ